MHFSYVVLFFTVAIFTKISSAIEATCLSMLINGPMCEIFIYNARNKTITFTDDQAIHRTQVNILSYSMSIFPHKVFEVFENLEILTIGKALKEIPVNSFENATNLIELKLDGNYLEKLISQQFLGASKLRILRMESNEITEMDEDAFSGLEKLEELYLSSNKIETINDKIFAKLPALKKVKLNSNKLTYVNPMAFLHCPQLEQLNFEGNKLKTFSLYILSLKFFDASFNELEKLSLNLVSNDTASLESVTHLDIEANGNNLSSISIDPKFKVVKLDLSENRFKDLSFIKNSCKNIENLKLSKNPIGKLEPSFFSNLSSLTSLECTECQLEITENPFKGLTKLITLNLESNKLEKFDLKWLEGLNNLKEIEVSDNELTEITGYKDFNWDNMHSFFIAANKFNCDYLSEMIEFLKGKVIYRKFRFYAHYPHRDISYVGGIECIKKVTTIKPITETTTIQSSTSTEPSTQSPKLDLTSTSDYSHDLKQDVAKENNSEEGSSIINSIFTILTIFCICGSCYLVSPHFFRIMKKRKVNNVSFNELRFNLYNDSESANL